MNHSKLTAAIALAVASSAFAGAAVAQTCAEKATRLKTEVDALPESTARTGLSASLGVAMGANTVRCEEILARIQAELKTAGEGHASAEKPIPNQPNAPAAPAAGPGVEDTAIGAENEEGHASEADPIPHQEGGDAPPADGPSAVDSTSGSTVEEGATGHASGDDPIPNQSANSDDDAEASPED
jgi:hypothetical protein